MEFLERLASNAVTTVIIAATAILTAKALEAMDKKAIELFENKEEK